LQNVTISNNATLNNLTGSGGGIYCANSNPVFDSINRCNIYFNNSLAARDIYSDTFLEVIVDTFTVLYPMNYLANPIENFSFDILNGKLEQVDADIYVSPEGDNANNGLTSDDPVKNIWVAFLKILADSLHPHTIHLLEGTYSTTENEEKFPITVMDYISLSGESESNVILDAEGQSRVLVIFDNAETSITDLSITGGVAIEGSGISCRFSNAAFQNLTISNNVANGYWWGNRGGGIYFDNSNPVLQGVTLTGNSASTEGGGIYCRNSNLKLFESIITNNTSSDGGAIYFVDSSHPDLQGITISENSANRGGGLYSNNSNPNLKNVNITNNTASDGGGLYCSGGSNPVLQNVTISNNTAVTDGGGIYCTSSALVFDSITRSNIYLNYAFSGNDLYSDTILEIIVDTFTVLYPTEFHADPFENFSFDILNGKIIQVDADLYVSPGGNNMNSGLTPNDPLKNIRYAISKIRADSLHQNTIHLLQGTYSASSNEEIFPLNIPDYISLCGESENSVILDAEMQSNVLTFDNNTGTIVTGLTIKGGSSENGGGIYCRYSDPGFQYITISNNSAQYGAGLYCEFAIPHLQDLNIINNAASFGGAIYCANSNPVLQYVTLSENSANQGGAVCCSNSSMVIQNASIFNNSASQGGAIACLAGSSPEMTDVTLLNNFASLHGGAIYSDNSYSYFQDVIVTNNTTSGNGGGLYCINAESVLEGITITDNTAIAGGGGIYCNGSGLELIDADISNNSASEGGGIYLIDSYLPVVHVLQNITMSDNTADNGGGFYFVNSSPELKNVTINHNDANGNESKGGGIFCSTNSNPSLEFVTINNNSATNGGGIYCSSSNMEFHNTNRCNIYFNDAVRGNDLYSDTIMEVVVDTFTVLYPTDYYAEPFANFSFDILNGEIEQVNANLYISPDGDNLNSGLTAEDPLKTLKYAFSIIRADSLNQIIFFLLEGTYSFSTNEETFPVTILDYVSIVGESESNVIIDGENLSTVFEYHDNHLSLISDMTLKNGDGFGISIINSDLDLQNITISNNTGHGMYGQNSNLEIQNITISENGDCGMYCDNINLDIDNANVTQNTDHGIYCHDGSNLSIIDVHISGNGGRGIYIISISNSILEDALIENNSGGGMHCSYSSPIISDVILTNNSAGDGGGFYCTNLSNPYLNNVFITDNSTSGWGGGIYCNSYSNPVLKNVQITGNTADDNGGGIACYGDCFPILTNITLTNNTSNDVGGAIYAYVSSTPSLVNSVLWNNSPHEIFGNSINITYSDIQGGWEGEGNIDENPLFIGTGEYPFALSDNSPCINAGNPDTTGLNLPLLDLAGNPRIKGGRIDLGAYENQSVSTFVTQNKRTNNFDVSCNPNPFSDEMTISWYQVESSCTKIEIWNSTGKIVKELFNNFLSKGKHIYKWNSNELPSGIYFIRLNVDDNTVTRKVVKL